MAVAVAEAVDVAAEVEGVAEGYKVAELSTTTVKSLLGGDTAIINRRNDMSLVNQII